MTLISSADYFLNDLQALGPFYEKIEQVSDQETIQLLEETNVPKTPSL